MWSSDEPPKKRSPTVHTKTPDQSLGKTAALVCFRVKYCILIILGSVGLLYITIIALREHAKRRFRPAGRWIHTFSRCPVSLAACGEAEMNSGRCGYLRRITATSEHHEANTVLSTTSRVTTSNGQPLSDLLVIYQGTSYEI